LKITSEDLKKALARLSMLRYFPTDTMTFVAIGELLEQICGSRERLEWLVAQLVNRVGEWPGSAEVRGIFCTRFKPADGVEADCTLAGFTAADGELKSARKDPPALTAGEATKLIAGLKAEPTIEEQIAELRERARKFCKSPATVRDCLSRIAELEALKTPPRLELVK
jgi:hypothetical protein